jgi:hypothetical protein
MPNLTSAREVILKEASCARFAADHSESKT